MLSPIPGFSLLSRLLNAAVFLALGLCETATCLKYISAQVSICLCCFDISPLLVTRNTLGKNYMLHFIFRCEDYQMSLWGFITGYEKSLGPLK